MSRLTEFKESARRYTKKISSKPGYAVGSYVSPASAATGVFIGDRLVAIVQNVTGAAGFWTVSTPDGTTLASGLATKASAIKRAWDEIDAGNERRNHYRTT